MDVYWSIERCGWVPCREPADPQATTWASADVAASPQPVPALPLQRGVEPVPAER